MNNIPIAALPIGSTPTGSEIAPFDQNGTTVQLNILQIVVGGADKNSLIANQNGQLSIGNVASGTVVINGVTVPLGEIFSGLAPFIIASGTTGDASYVNVLPLGYTQANPLNKLLGGQAPITIATGSIGDVSNMSVTVSGTAYTLSYLLQLLFNETITTSPISL